MEYRSKSLRLDDEVWNAIQKLPISANQFLRRLLSADGVFETEVDVKPRKKQTRRDRMIAELKASDPLGAEREDIEHGNMELPSGGSVAIVGAAIPASHKSSASMSDWRSERKPIPRPRERK